MVVGKAALVYHSEVPKDVTAQWLATVPQINTICPRPLNLSSNGLSSESRFVLFFVSQVILVFAGSREQPELRTSFSMLNNHWSGKTSHTTFQRLI